MTAPRFVPKSFTSTPSAFGKHADIRWLSEEKVASLAHLHASQWQHAYAVAIREEIHFGLDGALNAYAARAGCTYDRLTKILRGDLVMQSEDIGSAFSVFPGLHERAFAYLPDAPDPDDGDDEQESPHGRRHR